MKNLSVPVLIGLMCFSVVSLLLAVTKPHSDSNLRDFGAVAPGSVVTAKFEIENDQSSTMMLSGLKSACGVRANLEGTGIVRPGQKEVLVLSAQTSHRRGPRGTSFVLKKTVDGKTTEELYSLQWTIAGGPWLDHSEVWLGQDALTVTVFNKSPEAKIVVKALPEGIDIQVRNSELLINATEGEFDGRFLGDIELEIIGADSYRAFSLPVFVKDAGQKTRLYPEKLYISEHSSNNTLSLIVLADRELPAVCKAVCSNPGIQVTLLGNKIVVNPNAALLTGNSLAEVTLVDENQHVLARAEVVIGS